MSLGGRLVEEPGELRGRGLEQSDQLAPQFVEARQRRQGGDLLGGDQLAFEDATLDLEGIVILGEVVEDLGQGGGIPVRHRDRGGTAEVLGDAGDARIRGRQTQDRVLRHAVLELAFGADPSTELVHRVDVDPTIVRHVDARGPPELLLEFGDLLFLLCAREHGDSFG